MEKKNEKIENVEEIKEEKAEVTEVEVTETGDDFEQLLEESLVNLKDLEVGDKVEGEVINVTDSYIFVSLGGKRDAYAEKNDYLDKDGNLTCKVGDKLEGYIVKYSESETLIAKSLVTVNKNVLHDACEQKIPVQGKVVALTKGGYVVNISGVRAFCPLSQIDGRMVSDPNKFVGETYDFMVIDYKDNGKNIVVSRRVIIEEERNKLKKEVLEKLAVGDVVKGKVTRLTNFGAFIDLGGVEGLLHISEFSWARVESPSEILNLGDEVEVKVLKISGDKISLSMKALQENPFEASMQELKVGDTVSCRVLRNLPFGSFVEIKPGVEGLIPISELARGRRISTPSEVVTEGELVEAQILKINQEERKISLSLKALQADPWEEIENIATEGDVVTGTIENIANFGVFIKISDGVTGLMPNSKLKIAGVKFTNENIGEEFKVRVVKIDVNAKRISLEPSDMPETVETDRDDWRKYKKQKNEVDEDNPFSNL